MLRTNMPGAEVVRLALPPMPVPPSSGRQAASAQSPVSLNVADPPTPRALMVRLCASSPGAASGLLGSVKPLAVRVVDPPLPRPLRAFGSCPNRSPLLPPVPVVRRSTELAKTWPLSMVKATDPPVPSPAAVPCPPRPSALSTRPVSTKSWPRLPTVSDTAPPWPDALIWPPPSALASSSTSDVDPPDRSSVMVPPWPTVPASLPTPLADKANCASWSVPVLMTWMVPPGWVGAPSKSKRRLLPESR